MKVVFVGRQWEFNAGLIRWLNKHYDLRAALYIETDSSSFRYRIKQVKQRIARCGLLRALDETIFQLIYKVLRERKENSQLLKSLPLDFIGGSACEHIAYLCDDIHSGRWLKFIRDIDPDIIFSVCTRTRFKQSLYDIPRFGTLVYHEGLTPEYRGLNTVAWALLNGQREFIGYTLFKVTHGIDVGPILCQGVYPDAFRHGTQFGLIGHLALLNGLPEVKKALDDLYINEGKFAAVSQTGRPSRCYTWFSLSAYFKLMRKLKDGVSNEHA
jgi:methionyl-tRNA formyltransferase